MSVFSLKSWKTLKTLVSEGDVMMQFGIKNFVLLKKQQILKNKRAESVKEQEEALIQTI